MSVLYRIFTVFLSFFISFFAIAQSSETNQQDTTTIENTQTSTKPEDSKSDTTVDDILAGLNNLPEGLQLLKAQKAACDKKKSNYDKDTCKAAENMYNTFLKNQDRERKLEITKQQNEIIKELKEECKEARDSYEEKITAKKDSEKTLQDEQFELEEDIRGLEENMAKDQRKLSEDINRLQNTTNQNIQALKDGLRNRLDNEIDKEIQTIQEKIYNIQTKLEGIKIKVDAAYFNRREAINKLYANCYAEAKVKTDQLKKTYLEKRKHRKIKAKNLTDLAAGTKQNMEAKFQDKFDFYLHLCLKRPDVEIQRQDAQTKLTLALKTIEYEKRELQKQLLIMEDQIQHIASNRKIVILTEFKEKMHQEVKRFNKEYETRLNNLKSKRKEVNEKIAQIRQRQMQEKMRVQQANIMVTPQDKQLQLLMYRCNSQNHLLYSNRGLSSANSEAVQ